MPYMLLILEPTDQRQSRTDAEGRHAYERMQEFASALHAKGLLLAAESLASHRNATRVSVRDGKPKIIDGPFAEAKEMIGGFFLLNCTTREEAVRIAESCPASEWCTVEVRALAPCYQD